MKKLLIVLVVIIVIIGGMLFAYKKGLININNTNEQAQTKNETVSNDESKNENTQISNESVKEILKKAMLSEQTFIDESNTEVYFNKYKIVENQYAQVDKYAYVDLDGDGIDELAILTTSDYGAYIILHYEDAKVYGYMLGIRSFESVKTDGTFIQSSGALNNSYAKFTEFNKNKYTIKEQAVYDQTDGIYKLNGETATKEQLKEYSDNFEKKANVEFVNL